MKTTDIRTTFVEYFAARGHDIVPGASLVPGDDPTLLFTNSGMVQFKDVFLGNRPPPSPRAVTAQRCVRAGGKHNDLDNVGYTARHHTFFEMLGNFSFGDYFKREAIAFAWELLTEKFNLPAEKLWVTVYEDDSEAEKIWLTDIGVDKKRFARIAGADNFWSMGDTGPCGPCSEVFYDHGDAVAGGPPGSPDADGDRFVEVWNLVFMQFNRDADGTMTPLPATAVDTGLGLERAAAILQGKHSNYEIDLFQNLIAAAAAATAADGDETKKQPLRVIADHIRSAAFLITDGVVPSNEGRGYVLRRIIRRAVRHGYQLGCREPFMHKLVAPLVAEMGGAYPELADAADGVTRTLQRENEKFCETLEQGLKILAGEIKNLTGTVIAGDAAFKLYDTFGFPLDLTADVAREHGLSVDHAGFDAAMAEQKTRARAAGRFIGDDGVRVDADATVFTGYDDTVGDGTVVALLRGDDAADELVAGDDGVVVLDATPFYAESGGQVGDRGEIYFGEKNSFTVTDTQYLKNKVVGHSGVVTAGVVTVGDTVTARVDADRRAAAAHHHSATHLLHAALKKILGDGVQQKGSLVAPARLRFDFSHTAAVSREQLGEVEQLVNQNIRANFSVTDTVMALDDAKAAGAEALFGEKYDDRVRTIKMGASFELCGGTHVNRTGDIGFFKIVGESGVAAGVRRIEALTGAAAEAWVAGRLKTLHDAAGAAKAPVELLGERVHTLIKQARTQQQKIASLQSKLAGGGDGDDAVREIAGVKVAVARVDDADAKTMRRAADDWKRRLGSGVAVVFGVGGGKVSVVAGVTDDLAGRYPAGELAAALAAVVGGKGGGKGGLAQGGGGDVGAVGELPAAAEAWVKARSR